jgi:hypothetical protein
MSWSPSRDADCLRPASAAAARPDAGSREPHQLSKRGFGRHERQDRAGMRLDTAASW